MYHYIAIFLGIIFFISGCSKSEDTKDTEQVSGEANSLTKTPKISTSSHRYIDNNNGTVTDKTTGLIWLKNANCVGDITWYKAKYFVNKLANEQCHLSDGSKPGDWRLPTKREWQAMLDKRYTWPTISNAAGTGKWEKGDAFLGVQTYYYWSSSTPKFDKRDAWYIVIGSGHMNKTYKTNSYYVWPVRNRR